MKINKRLIEYANKIAEETPDLEKLYLFPSTEDQDIFLLYTTENTSASTTIGAFYFKVDDFDQQPHWMGLASIRPEEFGNIILPEEWGRWEDAEELVSRKRRYSIHLDYTYDDLLDLHCTLTSTDGYYTPFGSRAYEILMDLLSIVEKGIEELAPKSKEEINGTKE